MRETENQAGQADLIVVALSSPTSKPAVALADASLAEWIGQIPLLIISDRLFLSATASRPEVESILRVVFRELVYALDASQAAAALLDTARTEMKVVAEYRGNATWPLTLDMVIAIQSNPVVACPFFVYLPCTWARAEATER